ncbi:MAG: XdhC family protein [Gammaproteobacteria bacterium]|nr:XdhC family protein [Gammaproteobacteria bacterium]MDH4253414.1 XdhC family protein [Gammaproteobacteria bacterium]MDH5309223.1 XdhC family protein [Gammaproteobacteria bacterium]
MKRELLETLVAAREHREPVVLARGLASGRQFIATLREFAGDDDDVDPALRDAARAALDCEGARSVTVGAEAWLLQTLVEPARIVVVGAVHIAQALVPMALRTGYAVVLIDPRTAFASEERFPGIRIDHRWPGEAMPDLALDPQTAVVALSHDPKIDDPALEAAMDSDAFYIGALGSRGNQAKRRERYAARGYTDAQIDRIHGPIGLPLGGRSPAEIAVATLAEIIQARYRPRDQ